MHLQHAPPPEVISWADDIMGQYPDRKVILNTHSALNTNATLTDEGETLLPLVRDNDNLRLLLCGHEHGEALKTLAYGKQETFVLLADYQKLEKGGNGYLRILTFVPAEDKLVVNTFSPFLEAYQTDADSQFAIDFR